MSARTSASGCIAATRSATSSTQDGLTGPSNGQPNATLSVPGAKAGLARARHDFAGYPERPLDRSSLVSLVERLRDAEREAHLVEPGGCESLVTALVERQTCVRDVVPSIESSDDLLRTRHLRHAA